MKKIHTSFLLIVLLCSIPISVRSQSGTALRSVTLQLKWKHQFQFAGYYAAIKKGYYREKGIQVNLAEATEGEDPDYAVIRGKAQFGITTSAIVQKRAQGKPVVVLAPVFQHSPLVLITLASSGIKYPEHLRGKKIMLESQEADMTGYLNDEGLKPGDYTSIEHTFNINDLITGKVDGLSGYLTDETYFLRNAGLDYNLINPVSGGIDFYGDCLFTTEKMIQENPRLVQDFTAASLRGWHYAMQHPEEIVEYLLETFTQRHTREHLLFEANAMRQFIRDDLIEIGYSNKGRWKQIINTFVKVGLIKEAFDPEVMLYPERTLAQGFVFRWNDPFILFSAFITVIAVFYFFHSRKLKKEIFRREQLQSELQRQEEQFRLLANNTEDVIWTMNIHGEFTFVSPSVEKMSGFTVEETLKQKFEDVLCPGSLEVARSTFANVLQRIREGGSLGEYSLVLEQLCKDGSTVWTDSKASGIYDDHGNFRGFVGITRNINEKKKTEDELQANRRFLSELIENNAALIYVKGIDGKYLLVNETWERTSGYSREFALGKTDVEIYTEGIGLHFMNNDRKVIEENRVFEFEEILDSREGPKYYLSIKFPLTDGEGNPNRVCGISYDMTAQKVAEEEKIKNEAIWKTIVTASPDGIAISDLSGKVTWASPIIYEMWGYDENDFIVGRSVLDFMHPGYHDKAMGLIAKLIEGENPGVVEFLMVRKDKSTFYTEASAEVLRAADGTPTGILHIERDITERKIADTIMEENEKRFRLIFENAPVGILQYDTTGNITSCNENFVRLLGIPKLQIVTLNLLKLKDERIVKQVVESLAGKKSVFEGDYTTMSTGKVIPVRLLLTPMYSSEEEIVGGVGIVEDISERRENELRISKYTQELERLNEEIGISHQEAEAALNERNHLVEDLARSNSEKDKFFAIIAHDLRSPFQSFIGLTEVMSNPASDYTIEEMTKFNKELHRSAVNLYELLQNLLEWARMQQDYVAFNPEKVLLNKTASSVVHRFSVNAQNKKIEIVIRNEGEHWVFVDINMVNSVIMNLLSNAIKFTPEGGKVFVTVFGEEQQVKLSVRDTGIGMGPEIKNNLFKLDQKVGRRGTNGEESTGLGLLLVKDFIAKNGGTISVESTQGMGSTFTVTLPSSR